VAVENRGNSVAFMVHPRVTFSKGGDDVTPIFWSDNYFSLLPGEKKSVTAKFDFSSAEGAAPELVVDGWNADPIIP
jgi:exo-1,4-beta-D-glucosaminidase